MKYSIKFFVLVTVLFGLNNNVYSISFVRDNILGKALDTSNAKHISFRINETNSAVGENINKILLQANKAFLGKINLSKSTTTLVNYLNEYYSKLKSYQGYVLKNTLSVKKYIEYLNEMIHICTKYLFYSYFYPLSHCKILNNGRIIKLYDKNEIQKLYEYINSLIKTLNNCRNNII